MEAEAIRRRLSEIIACDGPWSSQSINLGNGLETIPGHPPRDSLVVRRVFQVVTDVVGRPVPELRVLDLACLEGLFGLEFARHGARVVGIEGRDISVRKATFAQEALGLTNVEFHQDDVRNLSVGKYGHFDVVLCLGILYHLDPHSALALVERIAEVCTRIAVFHTHVSIAPRMSVAHRGRVYRGHVYLEHLPRATAEQKRQALWGSLDNPSSFMMTRASLLNLLVEVGFTTVLECLVPYLPEQGDDHVTLVAVKGQPATLRCVPALNQYPAEPWPERRTRRVHPAQKWYYSLARRLGLRVPRVRLLRELLGLGWHEPRKR